MTIGELADAAGVSRRAVRFYVQRRLIEPPTGLGRGGHYTRAHLDQLRQLQALQAAGHSLDAIARILASPGNAALPAPAQAAAAAPPRPAPVLTAELWTRVRLVEGVELNVNTARVNPTAEQLLAIRAAVREVLGLGAPAASPPEPSGTRADQRRDA